MRGLCSAQNTGRESGRKKSQVALSLFRLRIVRVLVLIGIYHQTSGSVCDKVKVSEYERKNETKILRQVEEKYSSGATHFKSPSEQASITALIPEPLVSPFESNFTLSRDYCRAKISLKSGLFLFEERKRS